MMWVLGQENRRPGPTSAPGSSEPYIHTDLSFPPETGLKYSVPHLFCPQHNLPAFSLLIQQ